MKSTLARLERAERLVKQTTLAPDVCIIWDTLDGWRLDFRLGNGKPGGGRTLTSYHDTEGAAEAAYTEFCTHYPESPDSVLIICDI